MLVRRNRRMYDLIFKAATVIIGSIGAWKVVYELSIGRRGRMREEYKFAKDFLDQVKNGEMHPFVREKGFQAIAGDARLRAKEVEYLLSLEEPARALKDYVIGRPYLEHVGSEMIQIRLKGKYQRTLYRKFRMYSYGALYFALAFLAFFPLFVSTTMFKEPGQLLTTLIVFFIAAAPNAWSALDNSMRIYRAGELAKNQRKYTTKIVVAEGKSKLKQVS
jgi:hypothetical protein